MKVACICNMNNNMFVLTRYLRDNNIDAELIILNNESAHFHPSKDTFDEEYKNYVKQVNWGNVKSYYTVSNKEIKADLDQYDFLIACGTALAFIDKVGRTVDVISSYGSDLSELPFVTDKNFLKRDYWLNIPIKKRVRNAFAKATCVCRTPVQQLYRDLLHKIDKKAELLDLGLPFMHLPSYGKDNKEAFAKTSDLYQRVKTLKAESDILILYHSRQIWKNIYEYKSNKGTDRLYKGIKLFKDSNPKVRINLVAFEYGHDIPASKDLIKELGIEDLVHWVGLSKRKEIVSALELCDFGCGQFYNGGTGGGAAIEVMASKIPILHYREDKEFKKIFDFPIVNVQTPEEISNALSQYIENKAPFIENAIECYNRLEKRNTNFTQTYIDLIELKATNKDVKAHVAQLIKDQTK